jgi:hypothetical protein
VLHYLHDVLGSVVALTNSAGQVVERYDYDPYGTTTIMDAAAVPLALKPIDPAAADGYYHDHDRDGDIDAADYTDLMDCVNNTPYDPMCIYTHDRTGDRRVDIVDVGVYLAYADDQGLAGGTSAPELVHYGRPLRLQFDADGDGRVDMFDWYAMQTCFTKNTTRCKYLFDDNGDGVVNFYDLADFKTAADGPKAAPARPNGAGSSSPAATATRSCGPGSGTTPPRQPNTTSGRGRIVQAGAVDATLIRWSIIGSSLLLG